MSSRRLVQRKTMWSGIRVTALTRSTEESQNPPLIEGSPSQALGVKDVKESCNERLDHRYLPFTSILLELPGATLLA